MGFAGKWDTGLSAREKAWMSEVFGLGSWKKMELPTIAMGKTARGKGLGTTSGVLF